MPPPFKAVVVGAETSRHLVHVGVAYGRGLYGRSHGRCLTSPANATLEQAAPITASTNTFFMKDTPRTGEPIPPQGFRNKRNFVSVTQKSLVNLT
jgi:hypothetical protein